MIGDHDALAAARSPTPSRPPRASGPTAVRVGVVGRRARARQPASAGTTSDRTTEPREARLITCPVNAAGAARLRGVERRPTDGRRTWRSAGRACIAGSGMDRIAAVTSPDPEAHLRHVRRRGIRRRLRRLDARRSTGGARSTPTRPRKLVGEAIDAGSPSSTPRTPTARASARSAWPPPCAAQRDRGHDRDEVRLRHHRPARLVRATPNVRSAGTRTSSASAARSRSAVSRPTRSTSTSCTTRGWTQIVDDAIFDVLDELKAEGKIRAYGVALGPAIGWQDEGVCTRSSTATIDVVQTVFNVLEQEPGTSFLEAAGDGRHRASSRACRTRPTRSSGRTPPDTVFPATDHRSFRKREWLLRALKKVDQLDFLLDGRTIAQAAIAWLLANPGVTTVLPTVTTVEQVQRVRGRGGQAADDRRVRTGTGAVPSRLRSAAAVGGRADRAAGVDG